MGIAGSSAGPQAFQSSCGKYNRDCNISNAGKDCGRERGWVRVMGLGRGEKDGQTFVMTWLGSHDLAVPIREQVC